MGSSSSLLSRRLRSRRVSRLRSHRVGAAVAASWVADFTALSLGALSALPSGLSLSRASSATVQTSASTVVTAGIGVDVARVGDDGSGAGLVLEEARTNLQTASRAEVGGAGWNVASGTVTANFAAGPDGSNVATRSQVTAGKYSQYWDSSARTGAHCCSVWARGTSAPQTLHGDIGLPNSFTLAGAATTSWARFTNVLVLAAQQMQLACVNNPTATLDCLSDLWQCEAGAFPTEAIVTTGATATRAGERLYHATSSALVRAGRLGLEVKIRPKGSSASYSANMRLWTIDANNYAEIDKTTRVLTVVVAGASFSFPTALPAWAAGDTLEIWLEAGGGAFASRAAARVNGGATVQLGLSSSAAGTIPATGAIDLLCNGTAAQFSARVQTLRAPATRPSWA